MLFRSIIARPRRGYDAGKKINGTKRHIAVDVIGLLLTVLVTAASVQDRDAAKPLLWNCARRSRLSSSPGPMGVMPGNWSPGPRPRSNSPCRSSNDPMTCTPSRSCLAAGWSRERWRGSPATGAPSARYERLTAHHETYIYWALIITMTRRLARAT